MNEVTRWIIAIVLIIVGIYVSGWVMIVGGIVDLLDQVKADTIDSLSVAVGIVKVAFSGFVFGLFTFFASILID